MKFNSGKSMSKYALLLGLCCCFLIGCSEDKVQKPDVTPEMPSLGTSGDDAGAGVTLQTPPMPE
jgi:hypothetical protein